MPRAPKHCGYHGCQTLTQPGKRCTEHTVAGWNTSPRTASSKAAGTRRWRTIRAHILERDHHHCQIRTPDICMGAADTVDKVIPAAHRPDLAYEPSNLRAACTPCNNHKARTTDRHH